MTAEHRHCSITGSARSCVVVHTMAFRHTRRHTWLAELGPASPSEGPAADESLGGLPRRTVNIRGREEAPRRLFPGRRGASSSATSASASPSQAQLLFSPSCCVSRCAKVAPSLLAHSQMFLVSHLRFCIIDLGSECIFSCLVFSNHGGGALDPHSSTASNILLPC